MYCGNCGSPIKEGSLYCTACGSKVDANDAAAQQARLAAVVQKKPMPLWFKIAAGLAFAALVAVAAGIWFTENLRATVEDQLQALKDHDITKAYYAYTSKEFQDATSLDTFKEFVTMYPVLLNTKSANFDQRSVKKNVGILKGTILSEDGIVTPIEYELIKNDGKWKILSIHLAAETPKPAIATSPQKSELSPVIDYQLKLIRSNQIEKAYNETTSQEFRSLTDLNTFKEFIKAYPLISADTTIDYQSPSSFDKFATIHVIIRKENETNTLNYNLIHEDGMWKVWGINVEVPAEEKKAQQPQPEQNQPIPTQPSASSTQPKPTETLKDKGTKGTKGT